nr:helix-turn-helix transcriptional regulator [uncultured Allomuricauda sp.]
MNEIIDRVRSIIDHYGLTVSTFADKIGVQRSSISHLLNERNKPSLDFVMKVVLAYPSVDLYWLLYGKGDFPNPERENDSDTSTLSKKEIKLSNAITTHGSKSSASTTKEPIRIALFYVDGTFESFEIKK